MSTFFKLCALAPRTFICFAGISFTFLPIKTPSLLLIQISNLVVLSLVQIASPVPLVSFLLPFVRLFLSVLFSVTLKYLSNEYPRTHLLLRRHVWHELIHEYLF